MEELNTVIEVCEQFAKAIAAVTTVMVAIGSFIAPVRAWVVRKIKDSFTERANINTIIGDLKVLKDGLSQATQKIAERDIAQENIKAALIASLRNDITEIYYKAKDDGGITDKNRENAISLCDVYFKLGGNHYIHDIYPEIIRMPRDYSDAPYAGGVAKAFDITLPGNSVYTPSRQVIHCNTTTKPQANLRFVCLMSYAPLVGSPEAEIGTVAFIGAEIASLGCDGVHRLEDFLGEVADLVFRDIVEVNLLVNLRFLGIVLLQRGDEFREDVGREEGTGRDALVPEFFFRVLCGGFFWPVHDGFGFGFARYALENAHGEVAELFQVLLGQVETQSGRGFDEYLFVF